MNSQCDKNPQTIQTHVKPHLPKSQHLAHRFKQALILCYQLQQRSRSRKHLARLPDYLLKDIGLSRSQIITEASKPFWKD